MDPLVSIVIPVKNGEPWLRKLFESLKRQTITDIEIVVIDSGSSDNSIEICREYNATVIQIPPGDFNHGLTRNLGVEKSKGKFILMTVQDAIPEKEDFLEELLNCLEDKTVVAVCGLQVVPVLPGTNPFHWFRPVSQPVISYYQYADPVSFDKLPAAEKRNVCRWDDVCAMYKKEILEKLPFRKMNFGEDMAWCKDALRAGYKVCYNPGARVFHYHADDTSYLYKRALTEFYYDYKLFGNRPVNENIFTGFLRAVKLLVREKRVSLLDKFNWLFREMKYRLTIRRTVTDFLRYFRMGDDKLDEFYFNTCNTVPQAPVI